MTEPACLISPQGRRLAWHQTAGHGPGVVFLGGFRSDMTGTKAVWLDDWARDRNRAFLRFDYSGHGASGGAFLELLHRGGQAPTGFTEVTLGGFNYRDGQLDLDLEGGNPALLDQLQQKLSQQPGLQIEMRTTQREGQLQSKVTLKRTPS